MKPDIRYEDDDIMVINKPSGLLVIGDRFDATQPSLKGILEAYLSAPPFVVHRLDRDTSGLVLFAKNAEAHRHYSLQFQEHTVGKFYAALVHGQVSPPQGRIEGAIAEHPVLKGKMIVAKKGKASVTDYEVDTQWVQYALLNLRIYTGRTHQIRVHMQSIGHAVVADPLYGDGKPFFLSSIKRKFKLAKQHDEEGERPLLSRLALHAYKLAALKQNGEELAVEAPLPKDMAATITQLNKWARVQM